MWFSRAKIDRGLTYHGYLKIWRFAASSFERRKSSGVLWTYAGCYCRRVRRLGWETPACDWIICECTAKIESNCTLLQQLDWGNRTPRWKSGLQRGEGRKSSDRTWPSTAINKLWWSTRLSAIYLNFIYLNLQFVTYKLIAEITLLLCSFFSIWNNYCRIISQSLFIPVSMTGSYTSFGILSLTYYWDIEKINN